MAGSNVWRRHSSSSLLGLCFQLSITVRQHPILHHPPRFIWFVFLHFSFDNHSYSSESPLSLCQIHLLCLFLVVCIREKTGIFPLQSLPALLRLLGPICCVQLFFCFLLYDNTSKAHFVSF